PTRSPGRAAHRWSGSASSRVLGLPNPPTAAAVPPLVLPAPRRNRAGRDRVVLSTPGHRGSGVLPGGLRLTRAGAGEAAPRRNGPDEAHASQFWFWLALAAGAVFLAWLLNGVLLPFVVGLAIAFFLEPACRRLERLGLSHAVAAFVVVVVFVGL